MSVLWPLQWPLIAFFFEKNFIATTKLHKQTYLLFTVLNGVVGVIINQTIDLVINQVTDRE